MLKRKALRESISANLCDFLKKTGKDLSLPSQRAMFISPIDPLGQRLAKNSHFDNNVKEVLPEVWLPYFQDDTSIIFDLSEIQLACDSSAGTAGGARDDVFVLDCRSLYIFRQPADPLWLAFAGQTGFFIPLVGGTDPNNSSPLQTS
ncbi:MAG: hypothetical protein PVJ86_11220 [Phycisphaerales bacterium]|jgi:hypothetical protein